MTSPETRPIGLPPGALERLSRGLIAYGVIGLVVAAIGVGALVWVGGRVGNVRASAEATVGELATTMQRTADVLHDASATATSFTSTLQKSSATLSSAAATITEVHSDLVGLEAQLRAVSILGQSPLSSAANAVGRTAASLEGLDDQLAGIATSLEGNRVALDANATSLAKLGDSTAAFARRLGSGAIEDSLGDVQLIIAVTLLIFVAWSVVPAVGALVLGVWLRRELAVSAGRA